jgi:hypothetical protein
MPHWKLFVQVPVCRNCLQDEWRCPEGDHADKTRFTAWARVRILWAKKVTYRNWPRLED